MSDPSPSPPTKGARTRAEIVRRSAALMNRHGYLAAPMAAVVEATGIQKGGLYRHFESREALAYEAFEHAAGEVRARLLAAMEGRDDACDQLLAMLDAYGDDADPLAVPLVGGCPIMNAAIESDHAHPGLHERARAAMKAWHDGVAAIVARGIRRGEIRADVVAQDEARSFIACLEGAVMLTHLFGDARALRAARRHLAEHVADRLRAPAQGDAR